MAYGRQHVQKDQSSLCSCYQPFTIRSLGLALVTRANPATIRNSTFVAIFPTAAIRCEEFHLRSLILGPLGLLKRLNSRRLSLGMLFALRVASLVLRRKGAFAVIAPCRKFSLQFNQTSRCSTSGGRDAYLARYLARALSAPLSCLHGWRSIPGILFHSIREMSGAKER